MRLGDQREAALVWHVKPLVRVRGDRVGAFHAVHQMSGSRGERREDSERGIQMQPRAAALGDISEVADRVEITGIDLAGITDNDCWFV